MLTQSTKKPVVYDSEQYGGDDKLTHFLYLLNLLGEPSFTITNEDIKNRYLFAIKMTNIVMQRTIEIEYEIFYQNVINKLKELNQDVITEYDQERERERLIQALGGKDFCNTILVIYLKTISCYPTFTLNDIPFGHSMAQYEDNAGRKGLLIELLNKNTGNFEIVWCFERYRETSMLPGKRWLAGGAVKLEGIDNIIQFLYQIRPHQQYQLAQ